MVQYQDHPTNLKEAFKAFASDLLLAVNDEAGEAETPEPFVFEVTEAR
jgi:hypothetical protein